MEFLWELGSAEDMGVEAVADLEAAVVVLAALEEEVSEEVVQEEAGKLIYKIIRLVMNNAQLNTDLTVD